MARERTQFKQTTYLSVNAQGELYSTSKEPREGFELVELEDGNKFYKKVFEGTDFGFITGLGIIEKSFQKGKAKYLQFTVENEEAKDIVQLQLFNQAGEITDIVRRFIALLPGIDFSKELTISSNRRKNDRGYVDRCLFVNYIVDNKIDSKGLKFSLKFGEGGDVPMFEKKVARDGSVKYDYTVQDDFLYDKLIEELERFQEFKKSVVTEGSTKQETKDREVSKSPVEPVIDNSSNGNNEEDDLPF